MIRLQNSGNDVNVREIENPKRLVVTEEELYVYVIVKRLGSLMRIIKNTVHAATKFCKVATLQNENSA
jgi:hypothetical protein